MRAQVLHTWGGELALEEVATPRPGPGEALVKVEACGVGLTVLNHMKGNMSQRTEELPRIPGHEAVGRVVEVGAGVGGLQAGQRVMVYFYLACGACDYCRLAHESLCRHLRGNVGVAANGGYAEYLVLPAFNLLPVPDGVGAVDATAVPDAIATPLHVNRRAGIGPSDTVVVIGAAGGVGIHMVQMARLFGAEVIGIDRGEPKLRAVREVGARDALDFGAADLRDRLHAAAPGGITAAIDLVGSRETVTFALESLGRRGRLVLLTTFPGVTAEISPRRFVHDELSVLGSRYASRWEVVEAARLVQCGRIKPVVSEAVPLARVGELHAKLRAGTLLGRGAIVF
jgi:propanol-preferring alcohol dehydrogenase